MEPVVWCCQPQITTAVHNVNQGGIACESVRKRPVFHPELGKFFEGLRDARKWSLRGTASLAERRGLNPPLTYQVLFRLEAGQIKNPEPDVLRAIAALYELGYEHVVARFVEQRYAIASDLPRHGRTGQSGSHQGEGADVPAEARILERRNVRQREIAASIEDAARKLVTLAFELQTEAGATPRARAARQPGARKTG
jgi:hypothetical protein